MKKNKALPLSAFKQKHIHSDSEFLVNKRGLSIATWGIEDSTPVVSLRNKDQNDPEVVFDYEDIPEIITALKIAYINFQKQILSSTGKH